MRIKLKILPDGRKEDRLMSTFYEFLNYIASMGVPMTGYIDSYFEWYMLILSVRMMQMLPRSSDWFLDVL